MTKAKISVEQVDEARGIVSAASTIGRGTSAKGAADFP